MRCIARFLIKLFYEVRFMHNISVIGIGPGAEQYLTLRAMDGIRSADCVFAARRHAHLVDSARLCPLEPLSAALDDMRARREAGARVAVLVSGDTGLFSMLGMLRREFGAQSLTVVPGISALQAMCAELGESWQDARILSAHGRELPAQALCREVRAHGDTILFCDARHDPAWICRALASGGCGHCEVAVGERLSYEDARMLRGTPAELMDAQCDSTCMVRVHNPRPEPGRPPIGLPDDGFLRGKMPMTKREVRVLALAALRLERDSLVWDVGAGTGSVSVECALQCPWGHVYAVERDEDALELIKANCERMLALNVDIVPGSAPEALRDLPAPTHVFLGGCGGRASEVIALIESMGRPVRLVANAVTMESAHELLERLSAWQELEAFQAGITRLDRVGRYRMFRAQNPVFVISASWPG